MLADCDRELMAAVAAGRVKRGGDGMFAPYLLNGADVTMELLRLANAELVALPALGPPKITPSGERALAG